MKQKLTALLLTLTSSLYSYEIVIDKSEHYEQLEKKIIK